MLRTINILLVILMLIGAGVVYDLKYEAERATAKVAKITRKIDAERDAIATLKAEWSLLNQPKRLQDLTERYHSYLELDPLDPTQIGTLDDIPFKAAVPGSGPTPPTPSPKGSVKLAQPEKSIDRAAGIGKLLDRLPGARGDGPSTTGTVPKSSTPPAQKGGPMVLVPKVIVPKPAGEPAKSNR
jgi:hypothetical protein